MLKWFQKINLLACANIFNYLENRIACLEISAANQAAHTALESNVSTFRCLYNWLLSCLMACWNVSAICLCSLVAEEALERGSTTCSRRNSSSVCVSGYRSLQSQIASSSLVIHRKTMIIHSSWVNPAAAIYRMKIKGCIANPVLLLLKSSSPTTPREAILTAHPCK